MSLNTAVMFSKASDEWETPQDFYQALDREFSFGLDVAASAENAKTPRWLQDALSVSWAELAWGHPIWLNPPYSRCREFIKKAALEASRGCTVVCLVPSRTDTHWWHSEVYDAEKHVFRPGVEVRFVKGRLKFGNSQNSAPFPSVVIIFRPPSPASGGAGGGH